MSQPLLALARELLKNVAIDDKLAEEKVITILKALGNAGCPLSVKLLKRILFTVENVTHRIRFAAVQAVRLMPSEIDGSEVRLQFTIYNTQLTLISLKLVCTSFCIKR